MSVILPMSIKEAQFLYGVMGVSKQLIMKQFDRNIDKEEVKEWQGKLDEVNKLRERLAMEMYDEEAQLGWEEEQAERGRHCPDCGGSAVQGACVKSCVNGCVPLKDKYPLDL